MASLFLQLLKQKMSYLKEEGGGDKSFLLVASIKT